MRESSVDLSGAKFHLRRDGKGETLLFLHGVQGLLGWTPALERLARGFDVLAPDHPGFGQSDMPDWIDDVPDLAFFYLDLLEALDLRSVHVVGHSLGGWIALEMAIRSTARIKSLAIADAAGIRVRGVPRGDIFICPATELGQLLFADAAAGAAWLARWQATADLQEAYDRNRYAAAKFTWQPRLYNPNLAKWLHRIDVPTHIIWGEQDRVIPLSYAAALRERLRDAKITLLPNCGHLADVECPDLFAEAVCGLIKGVRP